MINMNLKKLRKMHRFTQEEVAEKIGVSRQAVAKWENGETVPDIQHCTALADLYGVVLDDLVHHSDKHSEIGLRPKENIFWNGPGRGTRTDRNSQKARDIFDIRPGIAWWFWETRRRRELPL